MSLLSFFATQRRRWFDQLAEYPADYFAGAWAALLQAETAFRGTPLYNGQLAAELEQQAHQTTKQELRRARKQLKDAIPYVLTAKRVTKEANRTAQQARRQVALTRRALERMNAVAGADEFAPEVRLRYLQNMVATHLALLQDESPDGQPPAK